MSDLRKEFNDKVLNAAHELIDELAGKIPAMYTPEQMKLLAVLTKAMEKSKDSPDETASATRIDDPRALEIRRRLGIDN